MTAAAISPLLLADGSNYGVLTATLAMLVGAICVVACVARLGFLANLLSTPILVGYMAGVALIMIAGQLGKISGISIQGNTVLVAPTGETDVLQAKSRLMFGAFRRW